MESPDGEAASVEGACLAADFGEPGADDLADEWRDEEELAEPVGLRPEACGLDFFFLVIDGGGEDRRRERRWWRLKEWLRVFAFWERNFMLEFGSAEISFSNKQKRWFHLFAGNPRIVNTPSHHKLNSAGNSYNCNLFTTRPTQCW